MEKTLADRKEAAMNYQEALNSIIAVNWLIDVDIQEKYMFSDWQVTN